MAPRLRVLIVGRSRCRWAQAAVDDYTKRLRRHGGLEEVAVKAERFHGDEVEVRRLEGERLLHSSRGRLVCLDERGLTLDSHKFAALIDQGRQAGPLTFALGGAYGLDPSVREQAWRVVRLSDMVMNHEVARVVLYEQLYRAMTLIQGVPYHH